jgi:hypothetical protein
MNNEDFKAMITQGIERTIKQGSKCVGSSGAHSCSYGEGGRRCVVGHMMTEEEHKEFKEHDGDAHSLHLEGWKPELSRSQVHKLMVIQEAHDNATNIKPLFVEDFKTAIAKLNLDN